MFFLQSTLPALHHYLTYVLVDKQGKYGLRNDFRDHGKMKDTLKGMIE